MIRNFLYEVCGAKGDWTMGDYKNTAIAAVRTASSYEKFPAEADMTVTAFSGSDINFCTVGKHKYLLLI